MGARSIATSAAELQRQRACSQCSQLGVVQLGDPGAHGRNPGRTDTELIDTEPDQEGHHQRIRRRFAAYLDDDPRALGGGGRGGDQAQHLGVVSRRCGRPGPIEPELQAGQIVGADAHEADVGREAIRNGDCRGRLDHCAEQRGPSQRAGAQCLAEVDADRPHLVQVGDHGDQHAQLRCRPERQDGLQLRRQRVGGVQQQLDAALARTTEKWRRLVAAEIEETDRGDAAGEQRERRTPALSAARRTKARPMHRETPARCGAGRRPQRRPPAQPQARCARIRWRAREPAARHA